jgi:tRNA pseudouridine55 synthase
MRTPFKFKSFDFEAGEVLLIDKPLGWTSFDVVAKIRSATRCSKVGHAGTLDPLATGLLILCTGKLTKQIDKIQNQDKEYVANIRLGATTPSYDAEFEPTPVADPSKINIKEMEAAMHKFVGVIQQRPPAYSAVKVDGQRAYHKARQGAEVELKPRSVRIDEFSILSFQNPDLKALVQCQKGTYIRSLAHDLGQRLGVGAYLTGLRRTQIGANRIEEAWQMEALLQRLAAEKQ